MFNDKTKVYIRLVNDRLIIRVGGGYESLEKFIERYINELLKNLPAAPENPVLEKEKAQSK